MDLKQSLQVRLYIDIVLRKKVFIIACLLLGIAIGLGVTVKTPRQYRATALLSYQRQKINPGKMAPDVSEKISEMVSTLTQLVTSRTDLEKMIKDFGLYKGARQKLPMEDVVDMMRNNISIRPSSRGDTFTISFTGGVPNQVVKVTNSLAAKFIEENLKYREDRATETSSYAKNEMQMAKAVLDKKEAAMRDYKLKYYNEMPEQRQANLSRLNSLQEQNQGVQVNIQDLERTRVMLQQQITERKNVLTSELSSINEQKNEEVAKGQTVNESPAQRLERLKRFYNSLLLRYTDKHPEVIRIHRMIEKLEKEMGGQQTNTDKTNLSKDRNKNHFETDPLMANLLLQMRKLDVNVNNLNREKDHLNDLIKKYEEWVTNTPKREAEWASITREYGELKKHFNSLVARDLQAQSVLHIEQKQKGSQFRIEDPARLPEKPYSPNFYKIMGMSIAISLVLGCGIALTETLLDSSFKDVTDVETYLNLPVVCSIPYIYTEKESIRGKVASIAQVIVFVVSLLLLSGAFLYFLKLGRIIL